MLSVTRFEKINSHVPTIHHSRSTGLYRAECACNCEQFGRVTQISSGWMRTESRALESLREEVLREHGRIVIERAGYRCEKCGGTRGLSAHHKVFRSHGRDDRVTNLACLDIDCHEAEHRKVHRVDIGTED